MVGGGAGAGGVLDVFLAGEHLRHVARHVAMGGKEVDLEDQHVVAAAMGEQVLQWGVGDQAAIPIIMAADADHWQSRGQGAAGHHMLRRDLYLRIVEIREVGGGDIDGADREPDLAAVYQVKIDQFLQCFMQGRGVIKGGGGARAARGEPAMRRAG